MARTLIVSDRHNSFFSANNIRVGNQIPVEGNYVKGDIIVNIGDNTASEAMWICVESGNPGIWEVVGAGAGGGSFVSINDSVFVNEPVNEVSLAGLGIRVSSKDKLIVHHNSVHLMEGVDYEISEDGTKIVKLTEGNWNEDSEENALFAFELFKGVENVDGDKIVIDSKLTSITNHVILENGVNEVEIGIDGFNAGNDMMLVFKNGVNMVEGVDYEVQGGKIVSTGEVWNENGIEDYGMTFVVFKEVVEYNGDAEVKAENIADGSIGMDKLADDVKGAIEDASNIDLSGYATKEELNELFQDVDSGKTIIADAIDDSNITKDSTFAAMGEAIVSINNNVINMTDQVNYIAENDLTEVYEVLMNIDTKLKNDMELTNQIIDILVGLGVDITYEATIEEVYSAIRNLNVVKICTAEASDVIEGKLFANIDGDLVEGTIVNYGDVTVTPSSSSKTLTPGYYNSIKISGDNDLVASNIKSGVTIFGVTGTMSPAPSAPNNLFLVETRTGTATSSGSKVFSWTCPYVGYVQAEVHCNINSWGTTSGNANSTYVKFVVCGTTVCNAKMASDGKDFYKHQSYVSVYPGGTVECYLTDANNRGNSFTVYIKLLGQ